MPNSTATVAGPLELPKGYTSWSKVLLSKQGQAELMCEFQAKAAEALGVAPGALRLHHKWLASDMKRATSQRGNWHRDYWGEDDYASSIIGEPTTEFLLGEFPEAYCDPTRDIRELEPSMKIWSPPQATIVVMTPYTIHRRPVLREGVPRVYLIAETGLRSRENPALAKLRQEQRDS